MSNKVDRQELHDYLWSQTDRVGRVEIFQTGLAEKLGVTKPTMSLIIKEMVEAGRIRKISAKKRNVGVYQIYDPAGIDHDFILSPKSDLVPRCERCGLTKELGPHIAKVGR